MRIVFAGIVAVFLGQAAFAQTCEDIAGQFFNSIREEKTAEGSARAWATNPYAAGMKDSIDQFTTKLTSNLSFLGKYRGNELVVKKEVAGRFVYLYYFVVFDRQPMKFEVQCYKPVDKWVLHNLQFSDKITSDVVDAASRDLFRGGE
ncbi:MAG TPA: hypothetical protein VFV19_12610 [Candidatus Polarisedimenticolaceae bacterium]|nr:hypothetical protein [Candidatus Polarisedimenticolaceae bacterium]